MGIVQGVLSLRSVETVTSGNMTIWKGTIMENTQAK